MIRREIHGSRIPLLSCEVPRGFSQFSCTGILSLLRSKGSSLSIPTWDPLPLFWICASLIAKPLSLLHLRELPTPVIASDAREPDPLCTRSVRVPPMLWPPEPSQKGARGGWYDVTFAQRTLSRNGGHGLTQRDDEKNIRVWEFGKQPMDHVHTQSAVLS